MRHVDRTNLTNRRAGMTTAEFMVSAGVMLGLTVLTFDVMVAGAKVSSTSAKESGETQESRVAADEMMKEASEGSALLSSLNVPIFGTINSCDKTVIISAPAYDASGNRIANTDQLTIYQVLTVSGKKCLYKFPARRRLGLILSVSNRTLIKEDVEDIEIRFGRMQTLYYDPLTNSFPLPGPDRNNVNAARSISIRKIRAPWANLTLDTREKIRSSGRVTLDKNALEIQGAIPANATVDVFYYVNPKLTKPNSTEMLANMLEITIKTKNQKAQGNPDASPGPDESGGRTITTSTVLRNAH